MSGDEASMRCRSGTLFGIGLSVGLVVGIAIGTAVALGVSTNAMDTVRNLLDRVSGRTNQVNFELLLQ